MTERLSKPRSHRVCSEQLVDARKRLLPEFSKYKFGGQLQPTNMVARWSFRASPGNRANGVVKACHYYRYNLAHAGWDLLAYFTVLFRILGFPYWFHESYNFPHSEVWEWISNCIPQSYRCNHLSILGSQFMLIKWDQCWNVAIWTPGNKLQWILKKMHLKLSSVNWQPSGLGLNVLNDTLTKHSQTCGNTPCNKS